MDKHESIIIPADNKRTLIISLLIFLILVALKWFVIGYLIGKKECD